MGPENSVNRTSEADAEIDLSKISLPADLLPRFRIAKDGTPVAREKAEAEPSVEKNIYVTVGKRCSEFFNKDVRGKDIRHVIPRDASNYERLITFGSLYEQALEELEHGKKDLLFDAAEPFRGMHWDSTTRMNPYLEGLLELAYRVRKAASDAEYAEIVRRENAERRAKLLRRAEEAQAELDRVRKYAHLRSGSKGTVQTSPPADFGKSELPPFLKSDPGVPFKPNPRSVV